MLSAFMARLRETKIALLLRSRISSWPWYQHIPVGNIFIYHLKLKLRVFLSLLSDTARMNSETRHRLKLTRTFKGSDSSPVLVIGNGPSAKSLTIEQVVRFKSMGGKIAVMNGFADSHLSGIVQPDYYCLADPGYWNPTNQSDFEHLERIQNLLEQNSPQCIVVQPVHQKAIFDGNHRYIFVDGRSVAGLYRSARPDRPWGLPGSVAMIAIATMQFIGHSVVYFTGLDSVVSRSYFVDDMNELLWDSRGHYFYTDIAYRENRPGLVEPGVLKVGPGLLRNFADVLYSDAVFRQDLYWLMKESCVNVGNDRTNDAAPRACLLG